LWGIALQPVRLVLLLLVGPREGENDFLEFPSVEEAVAYARELYGERRFQLEGIEDRSGRSVVCYDDLHDRCRTARNSQSDSRLQNELILIRAIDNSLIMHRFVPL
jgi:hypothetical protein